MRDYTLLFALGELPDEMRPYAYGGRLVAPSKPDAPSLGAGVAWRRIAAGYLCQAYRDNFGMLLQAYRDNFGPLQLGVGVKRGPEIIALAMQLALQRNPSWVAVKLDFGLL